MAKYIVRVVCRAESHAPREPYVARLEYDSEHPDTRVHGFSNEGAVVIAGEAFASRDVFGSSKHAPDFDRIDAFHESGRHKAEIECTLCGLRVELRHETARRLLEGLVGSAEWREASHTAGGHTMTWFRSSIGLEALAAIL